MGIVEGKARRMAGWGILLMTLLGFSSSSRAAEDARDNIVILLDSSGSMAERMPGARQDKLSVAKRALKEVLERLPTSTQVGLLVFGGSARQDDWIYPLGPREDAKLFSSIDRMRAEGGTPLGAYIKRAADRLLEQRGRQLGYGTFRLLIVSDGEAQDQALVNRYTPEVMSRGITVDVIGVAMGRRHTLATQVHSYRSANDAEALRQALREVLAEVGGAANDVADADSFAVLEPVPTEVAEAALQALALSGNQPIGERPRPGAARDDAGTPPQSQNSPAAQPSMQTVSPVPAPVSHGIVRSGPSGIGSIILGSGCSFFTLFAILVFIRVLRRRSRNR